MEVQPVSVREAALDLKCLMCANTQQAGVQAEEGMQQRVYWIEAPFKFHCLQQQFDSSKHLDPCW